MREKRKKIWIDRFQTHLSLLFVLYSVLYQVVVLCLILCWRVLIEVFESISGSEASWLFYVTAPLILLLVAGYFTYDGVKYTHRIVGPLYRFRKTIKAVVAGEPIDLVKLRQGDYLEEMKDDLNELLQLLEQRGVIQLKKPVPQPAQHEPVAS